MNGKGDSGKTVRELRETPHAEYRNFEGRRYVDRQGYSDAGASAGPRYGYSRIRRKPARYQKRSYRRR